MKLLNAGSIVQDPLPPTDWERERKDRRNATNRRSRKKIKQERKDGKQRIKTLEVEVLRQKEKIASLEAKVKFLHLETRLAEWGDTLIG